MPSPSPNHPSLRRQRRNSVTSGMGDPMPVEEDPLLIPSSNPEDHDALGREPGGQTSTPVPAASRALDVVVELNPLIRTTGRLTSRRRP